MTEQIIAYGAQVERSTDGTTWTDIPEAMGLGIPTVTTEYKDVTSLDSPGGFREYIPGLKDGGEVTIPMGYTAAGYAMMLSDQATGDPIHYRTTMKPQPSQSSGDVFTFTAYPTPSIETNDLGEPISVSVILRTTGALTWVAGT